MTFPRKPWMLTAVSAAISATCIHAQALEFKADNGVEAKVNTLITLGTQIRTKDPSPDAYSAAVSPFVTGVARGNLAGQNGGSDLNYYKGDQISTVLKASTDIDLKKGNMGLFLRANAWKDFAQGETDVAYGNYVNGFAQGRPLKDDGFDSSSKFSRAEFRDVYAYSSGSPGAGLTLSGRLGRQVLNWGGAQLTGGGVNAAINPTDFSSQLRPGAQPVDGKLPLGMLSARLAEGTAWSLEGFAAFEHRGNVYPACGTYFDVASFIASGCNMISFAGASEQQRLASDAYVHRTPDVKPSGGLNHFGLAGGFKSEALDADLKFYAMNTTSVTPSYRMTVNSTTGGTPANPTNTSYGLVYPEDVLVFGASFNKKLNAEVAAYGELAYRANQPISFNASDLLGAFVVRSPASLLALRKDILSVPAGGTFDAYDRFGVVTGSLGSNAVFAKTLGAERVVVVGEVGFSHINSLPSQDQLRFGRGTAYGAAAYVGTNGSLTACAEAVGGKQCTTDGYTTSNAWGVRLLSSATYADAVAGAALTPSLLLAKDVRGYAYDGSYSQGRTVIRPGLRADWARTHFVDLQYNHYVGGRYNLLVDRDYLSLTVGTRF
ncbi:MAG: hypothetical protein RIQ60_1141 [Pseudomonadota bacterium]|jgi:hypothetical protein